MGVCIRFPRHIDVSDCHTCGEFMWEHGDRRP